MLPRTPIGIVAMSRCVSAAVWSCGARGVDLEALAEGLSSALGAAAGLGQGLDIRALGPAERGHAFSPLLGLGFCTGTRLRSRLIGVNQRVEEQSEEVQDAPKEI